MAYYLRLFDNNDVVYPYYYQESRDGSCGLPCGGERVRSQWNQAFGEIIAENSRDSQNDFPDNTNVLISRGVAELAKQVATAVTLSAKTISRQATGRPS